MKKLAFIFPGQGAQYTGMGKDFYNQYPICKKVYDLASDVTGVDIAKLCFEENNEINITEYTQIAMLTTEVAMYMALKEKSITADVSAGLSLGEYGALVVSGVLSMEDAFSIVRKRGIFMQQAVPSGGAMTAVLGLSNECVYDECEKNQGIVSIANYNCPGQVIITGEEVAVNEVSEKLISLGAKRCIPLNVSGPFHCNMLNDASAKLKLELGHVITNKPFIPYVSNVTAEYVYDAFAVKELLVQQVCAPVKWQQSIEKMIENGVDTFVEIGPGRMLSGFIRKINKKVKSVNVQTVNNLENVICLLN